MEDRHRLEMAEQETKLNTRINQLEGRTLEEAKRAARLDQRIQELEKLKSDAAFKSVCGSISRLPQTETSELIIA